MLVGTSLATQSVFSPRVSDLQQDPRSERASQTDTSANGPAAKADDPSAAAKKVQPPSETEKPRDSTSGKSVSGEELSEEEERRVQELKERDAEVRAHEQAHAAAGGPYAGAPKYEFTNGPDGKRYATSGEVAIDVTPVRGNPEATIRKMEVVVRAALAPSEPSSQDLAVARTAQQQRSEAQAELAKQRDSELTGKGDESNLTGSTDDPSASSNNPSQQLVVQAGAAYGDQTDEDAAAFAKQLFTATQDTSFVV